MFDSGGSDEDISITDELAALPKLATDASEAPHDRASEGDDGYRAKEAAKNALWIGFRPK